MQKWEHLEVLAWQTFGTLTKISLVNGMPVGEERGGLVGGGVDAIQFLIELGEDGWELIQVIPMNDERELLMFFKRPKE